MFGTYYDHHQLEGYLKAFGSFFSDLEVRRYDITDAEKQRFVVPCEYAPKDRWFVRREQDPDFTKGVALTVPRIAYEMTGISYDNSRKSNSLDKLVFDGTSPQQTLTRLYVGVPYNINLDLGILVKYQSDGTQLLEQILPYFTPDLTFKIMAVPDLGIPADQVALVINSVTEQDNYEGTGEERRTIVWNLSFTMKVLFYGPIKKQGRVNDVIINVWNAPLSDIQHGEQRVVTEDSRFFELEDNSGVLVTEETPETYLSTTPTVKVEAVANADSQSGSTVTITENLTS